MIRVTGIWLVLLVALSGLAFGQTPLHSLLGPGGFGIWSGPGVEQQVLQQFNNPQFYGATDPHGPGGIARQIQTPQAQQPMGGRYAQGYPPYSQYPQGGYYPQSSGVSPDWYNQPPASPMPPTQVQPAPPQVQAPPQMQAPVQVQPPAQAQAPAPRIRRAPPRAPATPPQQAATSQPGPPLRPGQYAPGQMPPQDEELPDGAVRMTTTTPDGTTVQYFLPPGTPVQAGGAIQPATGRQRAVQPRRIKSPAQTAPAREQTAPAPQQAAAPRETVSTQQSPTTHVPMPAPEAAPSGRDPRAGWERAVNRPPKTQ